MKTAPSSEPRRFPIQTPYRRDSRQARIPEPVYMAAYEVYSAVYGPQEAMIDLEGRNCRGGFGVSELAAFLYARAFPRDQWRQRVDEAFRGMENLS